MQKYIYYSVMLFTLLVFFSCSKNNEQTFYSSGTLEATEIVVGSQANGELLTLDVEEGDAVTVGQVIARVDTEKLVLQEQQLEAGLLELSLNRVNAKRSVALARENLDNVQKKYDRIKALLNGGSTTQQNFDDIETALKSAQTQYDNAKTSLNVLSAKESQLEAQKALIKSQLKDCVITSPIDGVVLEKYIDAGELIRMGSNIVNIADIRKMWIKFYITEADFGQVKIGDSARFVSGIEPPKEFTGKITWISPKAEFTPKNVQTREARADLVYAVKLMIDNPDGVLKIGMPGDVYLEK